ncbi:uncharacterized protein FSUBG_13046 [Fusarium subglutinans]|uniref:F-box domain-containing protein n=1 Tax=Gibberella subglutinans TaxID=42677 RepID=A0A8H5L1G6_GIBSU|nr:uncharacterized protein FSUBG_13046 [Fusarium subglutinans]KAF5583677.1 hypothetical protein FSUBG_13046 [Fusarium subglutinans]
MDLFPPLVGRQLGFYCRFLVPWTSNKPCPTAITAIGLNDFPDEVLMPIIHTIYEGTDNESLFAFFALRQVSRRLRRLTKDEAFDSHVFSGIDCCDQCLGPSGVLARRESTFDSLTGIDLRPPVADVHITRLTLSPVSYIESPLAREKHCFGNKAKKRGICLIGLDDFVRKGQACSTCQKGLDVRKRNGASLKCKFAPRHNYDWKFCEACRFSHPSSCFSAGQDECLARTGYIRLCEHKVLNWDCVRYFLNGPYTRSNRSQKVEIMRCDDPSHHSPCSGGLGGPKAETITMNYGTGTMTLPMSVIKEAIQTVREKGGKHFAPERRLGVLPEFSGLNLEDVSTDASSYDDPLDLVLITIPEKVIPASRFATSEVYVSAGRKWKGDSKSWIYRAMIGSMQ